jgi:hypothetical protein
VLMHFVSTGDRFPYSYYLGIMSAARCGDAKLWYMRRSASPYFERALKAVPSEQIPECDFPALRNRPEHWNRVSLFDNAVWKIVSEQGGSVMGLDSFTLRPFHDLLNGGEILVGQDAEPERWPTSFCMHGATVKAGSPIAAQIYEDSTRALHGEEIQGRHEAFRDGVLRFGGAGIIPMLNHVYEHMDKVTVAPYGVLGGYRHDGSPFYLFENDGELLNPDVRTIPFYATWQGKQAEVTEQSVQGTLLGRLIERMGL